MGKKFLEIEIRKLDNGVNTAEKKSKPNDENAKKLRADAKKKAQLETDKLRQDGLVILRHHKCAKKLSLDDMFAALAKKSDSIDEKKFVDFFKGCEKPEGEKAPVVEADEYSRLFTCLDEESEGSLSKESFTRMLRSYVKVVKETVLTSALKIKDDGTKTLIKLAKNDVLEVLDEPEKDETSEVMRVHVKAMSDGTEGWVTQTGEKGVKFVMECLGNFKVVKETILTDSFDLAEKKEATRTLHQTTKKLAVGDIVEVREWPRKEENSGLTRMKCRVKSDGRIGWATTLGNAGAVFLQVV